MKAKTYIRSIFGYGLIAILVIQGCSKGYLDHVPDDRITLEEVFNRRQESEEYLANIYARIRMPGAVLGLPWLPLSDEADITWERTQDDFHFINLGSWDANSPYYNLWGHYYKGIRSASQFMEGIVTNKEILTLPNGQELIDQYYHEARFLRAYFYFCLMQQYGPVVLLPELLAPDEPLENLKFERSTFDECVEYVASEFDQAAAGLPLVHTDVNQYGRATRAACLAFKSRLLLHAARPQYNGNTEYAGFVNDSGTPYISQVYSPEKWKRAADAAKEVIDLGQFELFTVLKDGEIDGFASYQNVFLEAWNNEQIFAMTNWGYAGWERYTSPRFGGGFSAYGATQQQVDAYFMANGRSIEEPGSGYSESGFATEDGTYTTAGTFNMYVNREPRFYVSITYNGSYWIHEGEGKKVIELYYTGNNGMRGTWDYTKTGYLIRKNIHPNSNPRLDVNVRRPYALIRLGEIYLNFAEAMNEYQYSADITAGSALYYVNKIRERAGVPSYGPGMLPIPNSQIAMREKILQERRVELAFENHRYFDTRQWKIAGQTDGGPFYGMDVSRGNSLSDPAFYVRTVFENRVFRNYYSLFPIPQGELDLNEKLDQNPGW